MTSPSPLPNRGTQREELDSLRTRTKVNKFLCCLDALSSDRGWAAPDSRRDALSSDRGWAALDTRRDALSSDRGWAALDSRRDALSSDRGWAAPDSRRDALSSATLALGRRGVLRCDTDALLSFADISISLLSLVVTACGLALFGVSLFVSWKLCWIPWRERGLPFGNKDSKQEPLHNSLRRQLNLSNPDFNIQQVQKQEQLTGIGRIKPELYKQRSLDTDDGRRSNSKACGKLNFILKYDCDLEQLIVKIHKAVNLPAKDFSGTSDPYVKIYLLPDRKTKHQTKVHRKTLNPVFDEVFLFTVPYNDLSTRKLHFSVYDFDRFSRHDLIGQVVVDNFLDLADFPRECNIWKDIEYVTNDNVDLGDLMFSLCYLPTAGRLTITIIKARNLKAMDITGASDPYVKVSLMCEGRRLKKRKTSTKRNTLNPVYNEAIVFDVPPENIDQINLSIAVMDYDRVGHNEVIGVCQVGNDAESLGRDHWNEMLSYPRKPIAHWHPLVEGPIQLECYEGLLRLDGCRRGFLTLLTYSAEIFPVELFLSHILRGYSTESSGESSGGGCPAHPGCAEKYIHSISFWFLNQD
ncbi:synaptotagmin-9 [Geospiza fortis]|uniref:Synaptotagmin-9 n=1 Tax=Geospiza fortis TaxID=48883 RepID=A0A6I9ZCY6_GEOFO|nr:synaptotagmin-9 [Geospiza fortis]